MRMAFQPGGTIVHSHGSSYLVPRLKTDIHTIWCLQYAQWCRALWSVQPIRLILQYPCNYALLFFAFRSLSLAYTRLYVTVNNIISLYALYQKVCHTLHWSGSQWNTYSFGEFTIRIIDCSMLTALIETLSTASITAVCTIHKGLFFISGYTSNTLHNDRLATAYIRWVLLILIIEWHGSSIQYE